ncbi:hypothetical protein ATY77_30155 [Rhizobium sp. R634]|uniref:hypothetical protein n=1 Tax=Rhizobium sp. R634 TaxID=1764274 RepID=UPI000B52FB16|nr:hypothetical protein [Rhizobium sp. R634]OWV77635.1 hypothetical protein ATY77_30155 [Rhizobium sp. R634]
MTSIISICNLALASIGKDSINALSEPTVEARACNRFFAPARDALLQAYPWRFAGRTRSLAEIVNDRPGEWAYAYDRPVDCLAIRGVRSALDVTGETSVGGVFSGGASTAGGHAYDAEGGVIYCNISPAYLNFTERLTDPTKYTPLFVDALSWHLAVRLAMPLTRDPQVRADAFQLANSTQALAQTADANEGWDGTDDQDGLTGGRANG